MRYLDTVRQFAQQKGHEVIARSPECFVCTCDEYIIRLHQSCQVCQGGICAQCGGCLKASHAWRHTQREPAVTGKPPSELLARLKNGHRWLIEQNEKAYQGAPDTDPDLLSKALETWADLEQELRQVHGYQGCIYGDGEKCPEDAPVLCDACVNSHDGRR